MLGNGKEVLPELLQSTEFSQTAAFASSQYYAKERLLGIINQLKEKIDGLHVQLKRVLAQELKGCYLCCNTQMHTTSFLKTNLLKIPENFEQNFTDEQMNSNLEYCLDVLHL